VWKKFIDYAFAAGATVIPMVNPEFGKAGLAMPTAFIELDAGY